MSCHTYSRYAIKMPPKRPLAAENQPTLPSQRTAMDPADTRTDAEITVHQTPQPSRSSAIAMTDITNTTADSAIQQSPPPTQRPTIEHHHSPIAGQHPDLPGTPARMLAELHGDQSDEADAAPANASIEIEPSAQQQTTSNGGARAAFLASQQQRNVSCNLSMLPPSTRIITSHLIFDNHTAIYPNNFLHLTLNRCPPKNPIDRCHHCNVHPTTGTSSANVHVGGRQRWRSRRHCVGRYRESTHGNI
jgi:hypothetical protein